MDKFNPPPPAAWADIEPPAVTDRLLHAALGRMTSGISPAALALAWMDWSLHLAQSPGKWARLCDKALRKAGRFGDYAARAAAGPAEPCIQPLPQDRRFDGAAWQQWPFNVIQQGFLLNQQWWHNVTTGIGGVAPHHEQVVSFVARQLLDMMSPVNFVATNPEVLQATARQGGMNFAQGMAHFADDWRRMLADRPPAGAAEFAPGRQVAVTPGRVVLRNRLMELIQYAPATADVHAEPILIVPAWIMKYYILDLSPHNSLIRYLVSQGYTVFCISWKNPDRSDGQLSMDDYLNLGIHAALEVIGNIAPGQRVHATGYCLGGTLLSIAAAAMARDGDQRLASLTLLAAQTDFAEPGELSLFIDESEIALLEDQMGQAGYLTATQMAGAFQMLRSYDLLWSRMTNDYLLGQRRDGNDLMAWNADSTRMPATMHSQYLRHLYLDNDLGEGRYQVGGKPVELKDVTVPVFCVATETDHVAPWHSVYKVHHLFTDEVTFVLTSGGHNAGIVSEPGHPGRRYRACVRLREAPTLAAETWLSQAQPTEGSWWPAWTKWLEAHSGAPQSPPRMGLPGSGEENLPRAPGHYVMEK